MQNQNKREIPFDPQFKTALSLFTNGHSRVQYLHLDSFGVATYSASLLFVSKFFLGVLYRCFLNFVIL